MIRLFLLLLLLIQPALRAEEPALASVKIYGQVEAPGAYEIKKDELNLFSLIIKAGGPTQAARWGQGVQLLRTKDGKIEKKYYKIDVFKLMKEGKESDLNLQIHDGDGVFIMERVL